MTKNFDDIIFCSFYTDDAYYTMHGERLKSALTALGIQHEIGVIKKAPDEKWIEICRKKIPFIYDICQRHPDKKVFWIDVDCNLSRLPEFVSGTGADIIGFQRGFSTPLRLGYHLRSRFWEPCFWGINSSTAARAFIQTAYEAERDLTVFATDDYFFEEAWRVHCADLGFQIIPSKFVADKAEDADPFFFFGSSGNVSDNVDVAAQHSKFGFVAPPVKVPVAKKPAPQKPAAVKKRPLAIRILKRLGVGRVLRSLGLRHAPRKVAAPVVVHRAVPVAPKVATTPVPVVTHQEAPPKVQPPYDVQRQFVQMMKFAKQGDAEGTDSKIAEVMSRKVLTRNQHRTVAAAKSFLTYATGDQTKAVPLVWWEKPYPGNFGDWLGPLIVGELSGHPIRFVRPDGRCKTPHLAAVGSIARFINEQSIVVGVGASSMDAKLNLAAHYVSLRGPITAELLREQGGPTVTSFGDPGLLLSRIHPVTRGAGNGRVALVRHYIHRKLLIELPETMDELSIMLSAPDEIRTFVETLAEYDSVITSAMHVYIICHSYGIPCALVTFEGGEGMVHGDGIKYIDYARGAGISEAAPTVVGRDLGAVDLPSITTHHKVAEKKLDEIMQAVMDGLSAHAATLLD